MYRLLSKPSHQMRVRVAMRVFNSDGIDSPAKKAEVASTSGFDGSVFDGLEMRDGELELEQEGMGHEKVSAREQRVLDRVAEDLARLGRVKRVGLGVGDKVEFLRVWLRRRR